MTLNEIHGHLQQKKLEVLTATNRLNVLLSELNELARSKEPIEPAKLKNLLEICQADELVNQIV